MSGSAKIKVLVTGAGALLGQGIIRSLRMGSLPINTLAVDPDPRAAGLRWADEARLIPVAADPGYMDALRRLLAEERPDAVLVGTDVELHPLAEARAELEREFSTRVLVSCPRVVAIADDKYATARFLARHGFAHPASALKGGEGELAARVGFPLVVKPRVGARSIGVSVVRDEAQLARAVAALDDPVIQECVGTAEDEYTAGALVFEGECRAAVVMRRDLRDGNTYRAYAGPFPDLVERTRAWAEALRPHGPANFQFRLDAQGEPKVFEINARFSGTTPLRARAGFNEVEACLRKLLFGQPVPEPRIEDLVIMRHWEETVARPADLEVPR